MCHMTEPHTLSHEIFHKKTWNDENLESEGY